MFKKLYIFSLGIAMLFAGSCSTDTEDIVPGGSGKTLIAVGQNGPIKKGPSPSNVPMGSDLTHQGNGIWTGTFGGVPLTFQGITPQQISQGMKSQWYIIPPNPHPTNYTVTGNGAGFTVSWAACWNVQYAAYNVSTIKYQDVYLDGIYFYTKITREEKTQTTSVSPNCIPDYSAKILVYEGVPGIYDPSSPAPPEEQPIEMYE